MLKRRWVWITLLFAAINIVGLAKIVSVLERRPGASPESPSAAHAEAADPGAASASARAPAAPAEPPHDLPASDPAVEPPEPFLIESVHPHVASDGDAHIVVRCTEDVVIAGLKESIVVEPEVPFSAVPAWQGFRIEGPFRPGKVYKLRFLTSLTSTEGRALKREAARTVLMPDLRPTVAFKTRGIYMASAGNRLLQLETVNVPELSVRVAQVYPNNLVHYMHKRRQWRWSEEELSRILGERTLSVTARPNRPETITLDLHDLIGDQPHGVFLINASQNGRGYPSDSQLVLLSNMGLTVKTSPTDLLVWANTLSDAAPLADAAVAIFTEKNQLLLEGRTDADGIAHFTDVQWAGEDRPWAALVTTDEQAGFITIGQHELNMTPFDTGGRPYLREGYEAFLYGERTLYRPGEAASLRAIVRAGGPALPPLFPVEFRILRPDGREFRKIATGLQPMGYADVEIALPAYALTGRYAVELRPPGGEKAIGRTHFQVEEFMPDRIKAEAAAPDRRYAAGETIEVTVRGEHLSGGPTAGRQAEVHYRYLDAPFAHPRWEGYHFGDASRPLTATNEIAQSATLDEKGEARFELPVPDTLQPRAALLLDCRASVKEIGGRAVSVGLQRPADAWPRLIGLRTEATGHAPLNQPIAFDCAHITPDGEPVQEATLEASVLRVWWNTVWRRDEHGRYRYVSERAEEVVLKQPCLIVEGRGRVTFEPKVTGRYELCVREPDDGTSSRLEFFCGGRGDVAWSREHPERLALLCDRESYAPGETAQLVIKSPFTGRALVTVEGDRILRAQIVPLTSTTQTVAIPIEESFGPNAYCAATVIRADDSGVGLPVHRAYGVAPLRLDREAKRLSVDVAAPAETRPGRKVKVAIRVTDGAGRGKSCGLTLAAVDEGILRLAPSGAPDPFAFFHGQRRLEVESADVYGALMPEMDAAVTGSDSEPGGGYGEGAYDPRRLNPIAARRVTPVALWWFGETDASGRAEVMLDLPEQFDGQLRLTAVACGADVFGTGESAMKVKQPLFLRASLPRALAPGDEFVLPAVVANHTGAAGEAALNLELSDGIEALDGIERAAPLEAEEEQRFFFRLRAPSEPGRMTVRLTARLGDEAATDRTELAVRPPSGLVQRIGIGKVTPDETARFELPAGWVPGTVRARLTFSARPDIKLSRALQYLIQYPHGCLEQTTSRCFPLLYLGELIAETDPDVFPPEEAAQFIQSGIDRVLATLTPGGGFGAWPGYRHPYRWGSVYATHFLLEARKAGYAVPEDALSHALDYLEASLNRHETSDATKAYACHVLALAGRRSGSWAFRLYDLREDLWRSSKAHVAAALALQGETKMAKDLLHADVLPSPAGERELGGTLYSATRERAILLDTMLELEPEHPNVFQLAREIEAEMRDGRWWSTQETAFAVLALGKLHRRFADREPDFRAQVRIGNGEPVEMTHRDLVTLEPEAAGGKPVAVSLTGTGDLYYQWWIEGVPTGGGAPELDAGLTIRRRYYDRTGRPLGPDALPHGEVLLVEITVRSERHTPNVVITDLLPGGLEIENPRFATRDALPPGLRELRAETLQLHPDRVEMRDDRLLLFVDLSPDREYVYRYAVRSVTRGRFTLPPVEAVCMYNPELISRHGAGIVRIGDGEE